MNVAASFVKTRLIMTVFFKLVAKPKRKLTDEQRQAISERAKTRFKVTE